MNNFEDHIKKRLKNHTSQVDTDALWNSISEDIPKEEERKKRGIFFLFFLGLGIAGVIISMYANSFYQNITTSLIAEDIYYERNMNYQHNDMMPPTFDYQIDDSNNQELLSSVSSHVDAPTSYSNESIFSNIDLGANEYTKSNNTDIIIPVRNTFVPVQKQELLIAKEETKTIPSHEWLKAVDLLDAEVLAMNDPELLEDITIEKESKEVTKDKKKVTIALGFTSGYSSSKSNFSTDLSKFKYYAIKRGNLEKHKGTMTLSGDLVFSFQNNMKFRTGVEYTRISESFNYYGRQYIPITLATNSETTTSSNALFINRDPNENAIINNSIATNASNAIKELIIGSTNRHHFIDIPFIAGYEVGKKKVSLLVEAGVNVNIRTISKGYILLEDGSYAKLSETKPVFNKNTKLSTYTGLSLNYDLGNNTQLKLGGHLRFNPFSITKKDNVLKQKYRSTGIHIGILHQL